MDKKAYEEIINSIPRETIEGISPELRNEILDTMNGIQEVSEYILNNIEPLFSDPRLREAAEEIQSKAAAVRKRIKDSRPRKSAPNLKPEDKSELYVVNGAVTKALMGRASHHIQPQDYFSENAILIPAGRNRTLWLSIMTEADIDDAYEAYQVSDRTRYWLDALHTLAFKRPGEPIRGTEMMTLLGYANPYAENSSETLREAFENLMKAKCTHIAIEEEKGRKNSKGHTRIRSVRLTPLINGDISLEEWESDKKEGIPVRYRDFSVTLYGSPEQSLPLAGFERKNKHCLTVKTEECTFHTIRKLTTDDRQMWRYVIRRIKEKGTSNKILLDTMFRDMEMDTTSEAMRKKRARMEKKLETMLDEAKTDHGKNPSGKEVRFPKKIEDWKPIKNAAGKLIAVVITPLKSTS